jgi:CubicO group peptidase (beta-lactamase class C family)
MTNSHLFALPLAVLVALTPLVATAAAPPSESDAATRIDNYVRGRLPNLRTPGLSLVVVEGDQVILSRGYGFADRDAGTPMTENTPIAVGSTNKGMTAVAVMQLVEQGRVDLDAPVLRYLPDFGMADDRAADITVRQLLSHTSGIPAGTASDGAQDNEALQRRVASLASVKLERVPGSGYEYSLDGYSVAGLVVQTVSGMRYEDYLAAHVFAPLDMKQTTFDPSRADELGFATNYAKSRGIVSAGPSSLSRGGNPGGGVLTSADDVGHYLVALLNGGAFAGAQVISSASIDQMWTPEPASGAEAYGFGWNAVPAPGMRLLSHAGDVGAPGAYGSSGSQFIVVPERHLAVGVLANLSSFEKAEVASDTLTILLGDEPAARPIAPDWRRTTFVPDRAVWTTYVGDYLSSQPIRVYREADKLLGSGPGFSIEFVAQSDTTFVMLSNIGALDEQPVEFQRQPNGSVMMLFHGQTIGIKK